MRTTDDDSFKQWFSERLKELYKLKMITSDPEQRLADARKNLAHVTELFNKTKPGAVLKEYDKNGKLVGTTLWRDIWMSSIRSERSVIRQIELQMAGKEPKPTPNDWGPLGDDLDEL
jgi:hypothetical protein